MSLETVSDLIKDKPLEAIAVASLAVAGSGIIATAAGFTAAGVAAGSIAASIQASTGAVAAGSTFAAMQSLAATGVFSSMTMSGSILAGLSGIGLIARNGSGDTKNDHTTHNNNDNDETGLAVSDEHIADNECSIGDVLGGKDFDHVIVGKNAQAVCVCSCVEEDINDK